MTSLDGFPLPPRIEDLDWLVRVEVDYDSGWSKNSMWVYRSGGRPRLSNAARSRRAGLAARVRDAMGDRVAARRPLWVWLHVDRDTLQGDAINCVDLACDGIQDGAGLDDRWTALGGLSWGFAEVPRLVAWVGQDAGPDLVHCTGCHQLVPESEARSNRCRQCGPRRLPPKAADRPPAPPPNPRDPPLWSALPGLEGRHVRWWGRRIAGRPAKKPTPSEVLEYGSELRSEV